MLMKFIRYFKKITKGKLLPTDKEIFEFVYKEYYDEFINFDRNNNNTRETKNFIPIDIEKIANNFGVDKDIIFSRFYYYFKEKYDYKKDIGGDVHFFLKISGDEMHVVHFPYLTSILAEMRYNDEKFHISIWISTEIKALIINLI
jgi:hypothetical protein